MTTWATGAASPLYLDRGVVFVPSGVVCHSALLPWPGQGGQLHLGWIKVQGVVLLHSLGLKRGAEW